VFERDRQDDGGPGLDLGLLAEPAEQVLEVVRGARSNLQDVALGAGHGVAVLDLGELADAVREVVAQTGVLAAKTRRALDSTVLDDAVATQDTVTQLIAAVRRVARQVPGARSLLDRRPS